MDQIFDTIAPDRINRFRSGYRRGAAGVTPPP
jgi:hypothetical protein